MKVGGEQLKLDFEVPGAARAKVLSKAGEFLHSMAPKLASGALMKIGVPVVAATAPFVLDQIDWGNNGTHGNVVSAITGAGLGGAWGAAVGAAIPTLPADTHLRRIKSSGKGAAIGMLMAPAVAVASAMVSEQAKRTLRLKTDAATP